MFVWIKILRFSAPILILRTFMLGLIVAFDVRYTCITFNLIYLLKILGNKILLSDIAV